MCPPGPGASRSSVAELAVLGVLSEQPAHGYELRQRLAATLGSLRAYSFGSLYPLLRRLSVSTLIEADPEPIGPDTAPLARRRTRIVYRITPAGQQRLTVLLSDIGAQACSDDGFEVHLAFFGRTAAATRVRLLQGRRRRLEERRDTLVAVLARAASRMDSYTEGLRRLGLEAAEREVRWLDQLIDAENLGAARQPHRPAPDLSHPGATPTAPAITATTAAITPTTEEPTR